MRGKISDQDLTDYALNDVRHLKALAAAIHSVE